MSGLKVRVCKDPDDVVDLLDLAQQDESGFWAGSCPEYGRYVVVDQATGIWVIVSDH